MSPKIAQRLRSAWPWLLLPASLALWIFWSGGSSGLPSGEPVPPLRVPWTVDADGFDLARERGHVVVLAFWATWCESCRAEGPVLTRVHRTIERDGDRVVGISIDRAPLDAIERAARRLGMTYPIAHMDERDARRFRVELLPTIVVVDREGRVAETLEGPASADEILEAVREARSE